MKLRTSIALSIFVLIFDPIKIIGIELERL